MAETVPTPVLVRDLMKVGVATCSPETSIEEIARVLVEQDLEALVVLDPEEGHALGVVGRQELVKAYANRDTGNLCAEDVIRENVPQARADIPIQAAAQIMLDLGVRVLFILHHAGGIEYPAASISWSQILRHLAAKNLDDLKDLGIQAERQTPLETFIARRDAARKRYLGTKPE
jgi:CBS domain-containing protein